MESMSRTTNMNSYSMRVSRVLKISRSVSDKPRTTVRNLSNFWLREISNCRRWKTRSSSSTFSETKRVDRYVKEKPF